MAGGEGGSKARQGEARASKLADEVELKMEGSSRLRSWLPFSNLDAPAEYVPTENTR